MRTSHSMIAFVAVFVLAGSLLSPVAATPTPGALQDQGPAHLDVPDHRALAAVVTPGPQSAVGPADAPWQASESVYAFAPDCARQSEPALAVNELGTAYAVWIDCRSGDNDLYFSYRPVAEEWQPNEPIPSAQAIAEEARGLSIAADSQGVVYVVWTDNRDGDWNIYFAYRASSGGWSDAVRVNDDAGQATQSDPVIAADPAGNATVVWTDDRNGDTDIYSSYRPVGGAWGLNVRINDDTGAENQESPDIAVDASGNAYVVWLDWRYVEYNAVYAAYRPAQGSWATNDKVYDDPMLDPGFPGTQYDPAIAVSPAGHATVVWETNSHYPFHCILSADRPAGGSWSVTGEVEGGYTSSPDIAVDGAGVAYVRLLYDDRDFNYTRVEFAVRPPGGSWGIQTIKWGDVLAADPLGNVHLLADDEEDIRATVRLANGTWSPYVVVNDDLCSKPSGTSLSVDAAGNAYAAVGDTRSGKANIYLSKRPQGGSWSPPAEINDVRDAAMSPRIAVDAAGNAVAIWLDTRNGPDPDLYASRMPAGGSWGPSVPVYQQSGNWRVTQPDIALDAAGNAYAVWIGYYEDIGANSNSVYFASQPVGGEWGSDVRLAGDDRSASPAIAVDPVGNAHAIWSADPSGFGYFHIYAAYRPAGGSWTSGRVDDGPTDVFLVTGSPDIAVDASGNAYAVWADARNGSTWSERDIYFAYRPVGGVWSANVKVNDSAGVANNPTLAVDAEGNAYAVWTDRRHGNDDIYFAYRPAGGSWQSDLRVNDDSGSAAQIVPEIVVDSDGNATALWMDNRNATWRVYTAFADHDDIVDTTHPLDVHHAEAESLPRTGSMVVASDDGASGCQYVVDTVSWSGSAVTWTVSVPHSDDYYVWMRGMGIDWNHNSFFVSVDGGEPFHFEIRPVEDEWSWGWQAVHAEGQVVLPFTLSAGTHSVQFLSREPQSRLDAVLLVNRSGYVPTQFTPCGTMPTATATPTATPTPTSTSTATPTPTATATPTELPSQGGIGGHVWHDADGDGTYDAEEWGLMNVELRLYAGGVQVGSTTTSGDGSYGFAGLTPGTYQVREINPGWAPYSTTPDEATVEVLAGQTSTVDFGDWSGRQVWLPLLLK